MNDATWLTDLNAHDAHGILFSRKKQRVSAGIYAINFEMADGIEIEELDIRDCGNRADETKIQILVRDVTGILVSPIKPLWDGGKILCYTRKIMFTGPFPLDGFGVNAFGDTEADVALYGDAANEYAQAGKN